MYKVYKDASTALDGLLRNGMTIAAGGFGLCGIPENLIQALVASGLTDRLNYRNRPNLVAVLRGTGGGRSLILNGHIDTVTVEPREQWTRDPVGAAIEDGRMYGRGTSDMKGGLMGAVMALTYLREAGVRLPGDVIFECVVNEEHAGNGTLDLSAYRALAIAGDEDDTSPAACGELADHLPDHTVGDRGEGHRLAAGEGFERGLRGGRRHCQRVPWKARMRARTGVS